MGIHYPSILPPGALPLSLEDLKEEEEEEEDDVEVVVSEGLGALKSLASSSLRRALASSSVSCVCI